ncbi:MAG: hypothetical protein ABIK15_16130 [Pseudomonadota bacterium]
MSVPEPNPNVYIQIATILTNFIYDSLPYILGLVFMIICKDAISNLIQRITNIKWRNEKAEFELGADSSQKQLDTSLIMEKEAGPPKESIEDSEKTRKENENISWYPNMHKAFKEGRIEDAKEILKKYSLEETDQNKIETSKAVYLYHLFVEGKDNSAIIQLEELAKFSKDEKTKHTILIWLSFCYHETSQVKAEIDLWRKSIKTFKSDEIISEMTVNLAHLLQHEGSYEESKSILIKRLEQVQSNDEKFIIFNALSKVEKSLGNNKLSVYCKDKSLEYNPSDRDELFNAAYLASEEDVKDIALKNYTTLLNIESDNSAAFNNLGVLASNAKQHIKAVENYKKSSKMNNTLAMANQGQLLLNAGFLEEAEKIANQAVAIAETPHKNVYSLLESIVDSKADQEKKWNEMLETSKKRQALIREYTQAYYLGSRANFDGTWVRQNDELVSIKMEDDFLKITWQEFVGAINAETYNIEISGKITKASFIGRYSKIKDGKSNINTFLTMRSNIDIDIIGFLSDDGSKIYTISEDYQNGFSLVLNRREAA